jgi:hypothetical protein
MAALSLILLAAGAVLAFAVSAAVDGVDLVAVGVILMVVGGVGLIASLIHGTWFGSRIRSERHVSADGRTVVEDTSTRTF